MSINAESILERKEALIGDLESTKIKQQEIEKAKLENVALQNALAGAIQQCDDFLKKLDDEVSDERSCVHTFSNIPPKVQLSMGVIRRK